MKLTSKPKTNLKKKIKIAFFFPLDNHKFITESQIMEGLISLDPRRNEKMMAAAL